MSSSHPATVHLVEGHAHFLCFTGPFLDNLCGNSVSRIKCVDSGGNFSFSVPVPAADAAKAGAIEGFALALGDRIPIAASIL